jgi:hypothetical protein
MLGMKAPYRNLSIPYVPKYHIPILILSISWAHLLPLRDMKK